MMSWIKRHANLFIIVISCFYLPCTSLFAQESDPIFLEDSVLFTSGFFDNENPLELTLAFDIKEFMREKPDTNYMPATLSYFINDSVEIQKSIRIKARGKYRKSNCPFPPFWLNVKKTDSSEYISSDAKRIKVVSHCKTTQETTNYLFKEYVAYKLYNIISDYSFNVRLLRIKYVDTGRKNKTFTKWAFMIEPEDMLSERLDAYPLKMDNMKYRHLDSVSTTILSVFQYMIGNTDYSVAGRHNIKLIRLKDFSKAELIPVAYDFDFSGLVNAYYAIPSDKIGIKSVTQRYYYDICRSDEFYKTVLDLYRAKKAEVFEFVDSCYFLDKKTKKYLISYLESFYKEIDKPRFVELNFKSTCVKKRSK